MNCEICYRENVWLIQIPTDSIKFLNDYQLFELEKNVIISRKNNFSEYNDKILFCDKCIRKHYNQLNPEPKLFGLGLDYILDQ